jgi:hypothetical protein
MEVVWDTIGFLWIPAAFLLLGLVVARWWFVALAAVCWISLSAFLVINEGWYGNGLGEGGGEAWIITGGVLTMLGASIGVAVGRGARRAHFPLGSKP